MLARFMQSVKKFETVEFLKKIRVINNFFENGRFLRKITLFIFIPDSVTLTFFNFIITFIVFIRTTFMILIIAQHGFSGKK